MKIYNFKQDTCEFICENFADKSPLENDVWLLPAYSTEIAPPAEIEGFTRNFNGVEWVYKEIPKPTPVKEDLQAPLIEIPIVENIK